MLQQILGTKIALVCLYFYEKLTYILTESSNLQHEYNWHSTLSLNIFQIYFVFAGISFTVPLTQINLCKVCLIIFGFFCLARFTKRKKKKQACLHVVLLLCTKTKYLDKRIHKNKDIFLLTGQHRFFSCFTMQNKVFCS